MGIHLFLFQNGKWGNISRFMFFHRQLSFCDDNIFSFYPVLDRTQSGKGIQNIGNCFFA